MGAPSKRAKKIRVAKDFNPKRLSAELQQPRGQRSAIFSWRLEDIFEARNAQMRGFFALAARLSESMRTDDAMSVARYNRLAPQRCIPVKLEPAKGARGVSVANEAEGTFGQGGVGLHPDTLSDITGCFVDHGVAFGVNVATPRADGSRIDFEMKSWPIEWVRWDPYRRIFITLVDPTSVVDGDVPNGDALGEYGAIGGSEVPIIHGDGRCVIFKKHEIYPWREDAAILPAALVWARHAFAARDWARGSVAHGSPKIVGELPEGMLLQGDSGGLTPEAAEFLELLKSMADSDLPIGIRPANSKTDWMVNQSTAWQVFSELVINAEKAAARIYLGTDGTLGTTGGAPGIDIDQLFGVAKTKVIGDLRCIERAIQTGVIEPWTALNFGDSTLAPRRVYQIPDDDADEVAKSYTTRKTAFFADVDAARKQGFAITQAYVDDLADTYNIDKMTLATAAPPSLTTNEPAATVVTVNEARAAKGLAPLKLQSGADDPRGFMTIAEFEAKLKPASGAQAPASATPLRAVTS